MAAPTWLRRQLSGPSGWLARPMAHMLNRFNGAEYRAALDHLPVQPGQTVLELGFGGGVGIAALLQRGALVTGVEPSVELRARALRKFSWPVARGELTIHDGRAEALPDGPFDHALSLNTVYFWNDVPAGMAELRRTVQQTVVLGIASAAHLDQLGFAQSGFRVQPPQWYAEQLEQAGFDVSVESTGDIAAVVVGT